MKADNELEGDTDASGRHSSSETFLPHQNWRQLAVGGWRLAVGGWRGLSLMAALKETKLGLPKDSPGPEWGPAPSTPTPPHTAVNRYHVSVTSTSGFMFRMPEPIQ